MKTLIHNGSQFPIAPSEADGLVNYISAELAVPNGIDFTKVRAMIDTGSDTTVVPAALIERIGADDVLPFLGDQVSETANGKVKEPTTEVSLRIIGSDGNCTLFQNWPVTISKSMSEPIIGMDLMRFFATQMRHGEIVSFTFDESAPAALQKRRTVAKT